MPFTGNSQRVTVPLPLIMSTFWALLLKVKLSEIPVTQYGNVWNWPISQLDTKMTGYTQQVNS